MGLPCPSTDRSCRVQTDRLAFHLLKALKKELLQRSLFEEYYHAGNGGGVEMRSCCFVSEGGSMSRCLQTLNECCDALCLQCLQGLARIIPQLRQLAASALTARPATAFGVANGLYHFCFYREDGLASVRSNLSKAMKRTGTQNFLLPPC